jgi:ABC-type uncharacterized transport system ATPase subunit
MAPVVSKTAGGLVDRSQLDKIDKLRRLGISVALPQVVVVGAQSAGKSSTLESITGFYLPRGATLCTRFATEIICRREDVDHKTYSISIQPALGSAVQHVREAMAFHRTVRSLDGDEFVKIFEEVSSPTTIYWRPVILTVEGLRGHGHQDWGPRFRPCFQS